MAAWREPLAVSTPPDAVALPPGGSGHRRALCPQPCSVAKTPRPRRPCATIRSTVAAAASHPVFREPRDALARSVDRSARGLRYPGSRRGTGHGRAWAARSSTRASMTEQEGDWLFRGRTWRWLQCVWLSVPTVHMWVLNATRGHRWILSPCRASCAGSLDEILPLLSTLTPGRLTRPLRTGFPLCLASDPLHRRAGAAPAGLSPPTVYRSPPCAHVTLAVRLQRPQPVRADPARVVNDGARRRVVILASALRAVPCCCSVRGGPGELGLRGADGSYGRTRCCFVDCGRGSLLVIDRSVRTHGEMAGRAAHFRSSGRLLGGTVTAISLSHAGRGHRSELTRSRSRQPQFQETPPRRSCSCLSMRAAPSRSTIAQEGDSMIVDISLAEANETYSSSLSTVDEWAVLADGLRCVPIGHHSRSSSRRCARVGPGAVRWLKLTTRTSECTSTVCSRRSRPRAAWWRSAARIRRARPFACSCTPGASRALCRRRQASCANGYYDGAPHRR